MLVLLTSTSERQLEGIGSISILRVVDTDKMDDVENVVGDTITEANLGFIRHRPTRATLFRRRRFWRHIFPIVTSEELSLLLVATHK